MKNRVDRMFDDIMLDVVDNGYNPTLTHDEMITDLIERNIKVQSLADFLELYRRIKETL